MGDLSFQVRVPGNLRERQEEATGDFWGTRNSQARKQGARGGSDQGNRSQATGGRQMDGFARLLTEILFENGVPEESVFVRCDLDIPGYYRATKKWDILVVHNDKLLAAIELKSQVGSFGNNMNNRAEEAIGSATDLWTAYREGAYLFSPKPWLGYLFMLQDCEASNRSVSVNEKHFSVFPEFKGASYSERYRQLCLRLKRERLYDGIAFMMSQEGDLVGKSVSEPDANLTLQSFVCSMLSGIVPNLVE